MKKDRTISDFDKMVYSAVSKIPKGEVRSYKWVAAKIGRPKAYRAVGNALNKNPYIGEVPCHRVIKSDGSIGGFAGGIRQKLRMLKSEGVKFRMQGARLLWLRNRLTSYHNIGIISVRQIERP